MLHRLARTARRTCVAAALLMTATFAGCAEQRVLMPAPAVYAETDLDLARLTIDGREGPTTEVLYATDRVHRPSAGADPYPPERERFLRLGAATVSIGTNVDDWPAIAAQSTRAQRDMPIRVQLDGVEEYGVLPQSTVPFDPIHFDPTTGVAASRYADEINRRLAESSSRDIVVYVAPFKVSFAEAVLAIAEFQHFLGRDGVFIAYSWPSKLGSLSYLNAAENAYRTRRGLRVLLEFLFEHTDAERVHLMTYSAGARVLAGALDQLALTSRHMDLDAIRREIRLGHVIFCAPDIDSGAFLEHMIDGLDRLPGELTIYTSKKDAALRMSRLLYGNERLGMTDLEDFHPQGIEKLLSTTQLSFVSVMNANDATRGNGHGYFRLSPWVSSDIVLTLGLDLAPGERGLVREMGDPVWRFPDDYPERVRAIVAEWAARGAPFATGAIAPD